MPWTPTELETNQLKNSIKLKFGLDTKEATINQLVGFLKGANGKKQAFAVLENVDKDKGYAQIKALNEYGLFKNLKDNSKATITAAIAPHVIQTAAVEHHQAALQSDLIDGYLLTVTGVKFRRHRAGVPPVPALPVTDGNTTLARHYVNAQNKLPDGGSYAEWYAMIGSTRSVHKRFFTRMGDTDRIWYTNGGTHGEVTEWYVRETDESAWVLM